jgi:acetoacetyl-[acyl-carrier protein] synthase
MAKQSLPVIVGFGGINGAGRASGHNAYRRLIYPALGQQSQQHTLRSLGALMNVTGQPLSEQSVLDRTLIRRIEQSHFDVNAVSWNRRFPTESNGRPVSFDLERKHLPDTVPQDWEVTPSSVTHVNIQIRGKQNFLLPTHREFEVKAAGQLPTGFDPGVLYASRNHPRGLQMTVFAASDALGSMGLDWGTVLEKVDVDQVSVYAGSAMGQLDGSGTGGMIKARYNGQRVTSKFCPLGFAQMPADFINAYVLGSFGSTGATLGACASFLYNLRQGIDDIRQGRARVAVIGSSEAPIEPEIMEGYIAMGALATDTKLRHLDDLGEGSEADHRRACRPFGNNCGFTIAESAQVVVLFDDALALELGATPFGAVSDVFVNADGFKKSISGPGVGNYITMARAVASARAIVGDKAVKHGGMVQAHGTGTPQNRVTESRILSETAQAFGIENWPVAAVKCYLGHSLGAASGDQITSTLGIWEDGIIPGISTMGEPAEDVSQKQLAFSADHREVDPEQLQYSIINSKGFGGNNASATMLSPAVTKRMMQARYSASEWQGWQEANEGVRQRQQDYELAMTAGEVAPTYHFDHGVLHDDDVQFEPGAVVIGGHRVSLPETSPFADMTPKN